MEPALRLRPVREGDEALAIAAHAVMLGDDFPFLLEHSPDEPWTSFVHRLGQYARGLDLPPDRVPGAFLLAWAGPELVGRASIRFDLNEYLATAGGHIGYGVLPEHRGRGFATEILRQSLVIARANGVERALLTCDVDNVASARVIERCGGVYETTVDDPVEGTRKRRYWIP